MTQPLIHSVVQIRDAFFQALWSLKDNQFRTLLSILGILVGIVAVMAVGTVTKTIRESVFAELESYGLKTIWIYRNWGEKEPNRAIRQGSGISNSDLEAIRSGCCSKVLSISPEVYYSNWQVLFRAGSRYDNAILDGVGVNFLKISKDDLTIGRDFREEDIARRHPVAIIGPKVLDELFGKYQNPIGKTIRLDNLKLTIIGLLKEKRRDFLSSIGAAEKYDINDRVLIPYTLHQQLLGSKDVHGLVGEAIDLDNVQPAIRQVVDTLKRSHNYKYNYTTESMLAWINTADRILTNISLIGIVAASISLFVGGIGIMNIMTTSVLERTREIGIRKAIGAKKRDILIQFLMEATFISTIGGFIGLALGTVISYAVSLWTGLPTTPSWFIVFIALLVSMMVGVLSGYYPARRAANLRPVEALRYQ